MSGNPKESKWYATPNRVRKRPIISISVPPEIIAMAKLCATKAKTSQSQIFERAIRLYAESEDKSDGV